MMGIDRQAQARITPAPRIQVQSIALPALATSRYLQCHHLWGHLSTRDLRQQSVLKQASPPPACAGV